MTLDPSLRETIVARLREGMHPEAIYLFGSHAYGSPGPDSDIDLLVVVNESSQPHYLRAAAARRLLRGVPAAIDLRVVTRQEFERLSGWQSSVERIAVEQGELLYAS